MPVHSAPKIEELSRASDPKQGILKAVGDVSKQDVFSDLVLVGTFIENEMTPGGIIKPKTVLQEGEYQGKVGLVLKTGPYAYADWEDEASRGQNAKLHTWVLYHIKDAWPLQFNGAPCRLVPYEKLRMRVSDPALFF